MLSKFVAYSAIAFIGLVTLVSVQEPTPSPLSVPGNSVEQQQVVQKVPMTPEPAPVVTKGVAEVKAEVIVPQPQPKSSCNPNYSGCLKSGAGDYDCASGSGDGPNYTGAVQVLGNDEFGLDRDHDGWACE